MINKKQVVDPFCPSFLAYLAEGLMDPHAPISSRSQEALSLLTQCYEMTVPSSLGNLLARDEVVSALFEGEVDADRSYRMGLWLLEIAGSLSMEDESNGVA